MNRTRQTLGKTTTPISGTLLTWEIRNNNPATTVRVYSSGPGTASVIVSPSSSVFIYGTAYNGQYSASGTDSTISDEQGTSTGSTYNECSHSGSRYLVPLKEVNEEYDLECEYVSGNTIFDPVRVVLSGSVAAGGPFMTASAAPALDSVALMRARAEQQLRIGQVKPDVDLLQFIGELEDFRALWLAAYRNLLKGCQFLVDYAKTIPQKRRDRIIFPFEFGATLGVKPDHLAILLQDVGHFVANAKFHFNRPRVIDVIDSAVGIDLGWKLAFEPFFRDGRKLLDRTKRLQRFMDKIAKPRTYRHRGYTYDGAEYVEAPYHLSGLRSVRDRSINVERRVNVWAMVRYDGMQFSKSAANKAFFGLYARPSVAYELTRLTFVLDMFIDVGSFLSQFDSRRVFTHGKIVSSGYSVKDTTVSKRTLYVGQTSAFQPIYGTPDVVVHAREDTKQYTRLREPLLNIPVIEPLRTNLPSGGQIKTIVELIYAAFRRGAKR